ncbi:hypothetical protein DNU06_03305 [Putridiphycobacter roseus]|uniref:DNA-binding response regulator n=1 Tax=Putridiphycobacter roseus TaxID=2219161 RepID=A0A2W1N6T4_9FLAO|nr:LytTR family DNA-binding domain-containing protein [Putridiphycobacter roseus]PZE18871.1 hypothetical protein DNU06_03305 [Putridiphycobacter roseus]
MNLKAIIIDDEQGGINYLSSIITEFVPNLELVGTANSVNEGLKILLKQKVDIIFLDIEMPNETGFDFIKSIDRSAYKIIFTTAHSEYAVDAFNVFADGYLMKPIVIDELIELIIYLTKNDAVKEEHGKLVIKTKETIEAISLEDIIRIESEGNYSTIYTLNRNRIVISKSIKQLEENLSSDLFVKTHKSHIINKNHIKRYVKLEGGYFEMSDASQVPLSRRKKEEVLNLLF